MHGTAAPAARSRKSKSTIKSGAIPAAITISHPPPRGPADQAMIDHQVAVVRGATNRTTGEPLIMRSPLDARSPAEEAPWTTSKTITTSSAPAGPDRRYDGTGPLGPAVPQIMGLYRLYKRYEVSRIRQFNQGFALVYSETPGEDEDKRKKLAGERYARIRKGDAPPEDVELARHYQPFIEAASKFDLPMADLERQMQRTVRQLPASLLEVVEVPGLTEFAIAKLIGEVGDVGAYRTPLGLRKRCGLSPYNGKAASTWRRAGGLHADEWEGFAYKPRRRSAIYVIEEKLASGGKIQAQRLLVGEDVDAREDLSEYQKIYQKRLRYEAERDPENMRREGKNGKESFSKQAALRAQRYMMQKFLVHLWRLCSRLGQ